MKNGCWYPWSCICRYQSIQTESNIGLSTGEYQCKVPILGLGTPEIPGLCHLTYLNAKRNKVCNSPKPGLAEITFGLSRVVDATCVMAGRAPPQTHCSRHEQLYLYLSSASPISVHIHAFRMSYWSSIDQVQTTAGPHVLPPKLHICSFNQVDHPEVLAYNPFHRRQPLWILPLEHHLPSC